MLDELRREPTNQKKKNKTYKQPTTRNTHTHTYERAGIVWCEGRKKKRNSTVFYNGTAQRRPAQHSTENIT